MFSYIQYRSVYIFQAKQCLTQALTFKRHEITYLMIGKILLMEGNITGAIDIYRQAVE
jgi:Bardet-Biedl syndrome 4 protein